jgi:hypothetical protein
VPDQAAALDLDKRLERFGERARHLEVKGFQVLLDGAAQVSRLPGRGQPP